MRTRRRQLAAAAVVVLVGSALLVGLGAAQSSRGQAHIDVSISENEVSAGTLSNISFNVQNSAIVDSGQATEQITTARNVRVNVTDPGPFEVKTTNVALGSIPDGQVRPANFGLVVPDDVEPGTYDIEVDVRYEVTSRVSDANVDRLVQVESEEVEIEVVEEPQFAITDVATDVQPGTSGDATLTVENTGSATAFESRVSLTGRGGVSIDGGNSETFLGVLDPGGSQEVTVDVSVAESATGADKPIEAAFEYEDENGIEQPTQTIQRSFSPRAEQSFGFWTLKGDLNVGHEGSITGSVRNLGPARLGDAEVVIEPQSESIQVTNRRYALPELGPTETASFEFPATVDPDADPGPRQVSAHIEFTGANSSSPVSSEEYASRVTVGEGQQFAVENVEESLSVGFSGEVRGTLVNEGPEPVTNGVLVFEPQSDSLFVEDTRYALPEMEPGEETEFSYPVDVSGQADPGPRQGQFTVEYQQGDRTLESDNISRRVVVDDRTREFNLSGEPTVRAGESERFTLTITNDRDSTLRNIDARLFTESPLSAGSDEAFVDELEPGESAEIQFDVSASGAAMVKTYPVELDFQYDNARGDEVLSDTYQYPVEVQEPREQEGGGLPFVPLAGIGLALVGGAVLWRRRGSVRETLNRES